MIKRKLAALLACAVTAVSVFGAAGCGGGRELPPDADPDQIDLNIDSDISATITVACENYDDEKNIVKAVAAELNKTYPNVKITLDPFSGDISSTIVKKYNANIMPDIFICNSFDMFTLSDKNIMLNFTPYMQAEEKAGTFDTSEYYDAYMKLGQEGFNGKQYMIPRSADRVVVHYNKDIFKKAAAYTGVDILSVVQNGWTWEEFDTVCTALRKYYDENGMKSLYLIDSYMTWEAVFNPIIESYGGKYFDENGDFALDSPEAENAYKHMKSWIDKRWVAPLTVNPANFAGGQGCMLFHSQALSMTESKLRQTYGFDKSVDMSQYYDVVSMPVMESNPLIGAGAAGYCAYRGTENPLLVWKFMKTLLTREGQNALADTGCTYVPVRKDMADYTDPANHWGAGYQNYNLSAYVYKVGGIGADGEPEDDWNCCTDYFAVKKPKHASKLNSAVSSSISSYMNGKSFDTVMQSLEKSFIATLKR